jgi:molecular chaperone DnaJ
LGAKVEIKTIDGTKSTITIPKGCQVGSEIKVSGKGFKSLRNSSSTGDLVVIINCDIPKKLSEEAKNALMDYAEKIGTDTGGNSDGGISGFFKKFLG